MPALQRRISAAIVFRSIAAIVWTALTLGVPGSASAENHQELEPNLVKMLPSYCKYTQYFRDRLPGGNDRAEIERWTQSLGPTFVHMHHYCFGLLNTNRAIYTSKTRQDRAFNLNNSVTEFQYVIEKAPPEFVLLPEMLTKKGENLVRLGKGPQGFPDLQRAIELKPDYWPPYAAISDYFKEVDNPAQAREWLQKGLEATNNAKALVRRMAELNDPKAKP